MNTDTAIAAPARVRGKWVAVGAVVLAAGAIGAALVVTSHGGSRNAAAGKTPNAPVVTASAAQDALRVPSIMSLTPKELATGALGTSYALSSAPTGPTLTAVLGSMSPETRRYTKAIMSLTFAQLAAGAAGSP